MSKGLQQCSAMQQVVRLLGDLGERYGAEHTYYDLRTPADAIKLLCVNSPAFQHELVHAHEHGVGYRLIQAGTDLDLEDLQLPFGSKDLILTPVIAGSGGGVGKVVAGVALVAAAITLGPLGGGFLGLGAGIGGGGVVGVGFLTASASAAIGAIGASLVLGGVSQLLSPQPTIPKIGGVDIGGGTAGGGLRGSGESSSTDGPQSVVRGTDGRQSYAYTGAANTVGVGATIPVAYGEVLIGSHLLSATVDVADESDPLKTSIKPPGKQTILIGGEKIGFGKFESASGVTVRRSNKTVQKSDDENVKRNEFIKLQDGNVAPGNDSLAVKTGDRDKFDLVFELRDGLFDRVSGPGTTLVDGFITYRVEIVAQFDGGQEDQVVASSQATVQGLLLNAANAAGIYRWIHRMEHPDFDGQVEPFVEIIDFRATSKPTLYWQGYGYDIG